MHDDDYLENICRSQMIIQTGLILGMYPVNERSRYKVTPFLNGRAQT